MPRLPVKFHITCSHVASFCRRNKCGLSGGPNDQWVEVIHKDFHRHWNTSYRITDPVSEKFGENLKRCAASLNSRHIPLPEPDQFQSEGRFATFEQTQPSGVHEGPSLFMVHDMCLAEFCLDFFSSHFEQLLQFHYTEKHESKLLTKLVLHITDVICGSIN